MLLRHVPHYYRDGVESTLLFRVTGMLPYRDSRLTKIALIVFFLLIIGYAYYEARGVIYGPRIEISSEITEVTDPFITIRGKADRIAKLSMNGRPISVTEDGVFNEPYLLAPGLNRIMLDAADRYGRTSQHIVQIVYVSDQTVPTAKEKRSTSSPATPSLTP